MGEGVIKFLENEGVIVLVVRLCNSIGVVGFGFIF